MARMLPEMCPIAKAGMKLVTAERILFERLSRELGAGWTVIHDCAVQAHGEAGTIEFVLIHGGFGLALLGIAEPGEATDPEPAIHAMRTMLGEIGFTRRFRGEIAIVARTLHAEEAGNLGSLVEALFDRQLASAINDPTWPEWLIGHLAPAADPVSQAPSPAPRRPAASAVAAPQLRAPTREEAWRVTGAAGERPLAVPLAREGSLATGPDAAMHVAPDPLVISQAARRRSSSLPAMGFAVIVVTLVLTGMALLSYGNGPTLHSAAPAAKTE